MPASADRPSITRAALDGIVGTSDPVLRNLRITQCYHDLSHGLARVVDDGNANWSTFATWASRTAGQSIRNEELPRALVDLIEDGEPLRAVLGRTFGWIKSRLRLDLDAVQGAQDTLRRVSTQVAEGNLKVFAELAPLFAAFIELMEAPPGERAARLEDFRRRLRPGPSDRDGQDVLGLAFDHYAAAAVEPDPGRRAQLMLLANCQIGLHEQTRLQPNIKAAMDAPVGVLVTDGLGRQWPVAMAFAMLGPFGVRREAVREAIQSEWQRLATRYSMTLSLPGGRVLPLGGNHVPWPNAVPAALSALDNADLIALLRRFGDDTPGLRPSGARDWSRLIERMGFICALFRATQQDADLFGPPFAAAAVADIDRGVVPAAGI